MTDALIDQETRQTLKEKFESELVDEVHLTLFLGDENPEHGEFALQLCQELNDIDERIQYTVHRNGSGQAAELGITRMPTLLIGWDQGYRIKYTGAPVGHEASSFIETISLVSRGESMLTDSSLAKLTEIDQDTTVQVFVTPNCPHCPRSVMMANQIAIAAKGKVTADCVEATQNIELAQQFNVSSVPQQIINGDPESVSIGALPEPQFVNTVLAHGASRYEQIMAEEKAERAEAEKLVDDPSEPILVTENNFDEAVEKYPALVVDCWAEWCGPCRMIAPIIEQLAEEYQGQVVFGKLDVDHNQAIAQRYQVMSIPSLLFFRDGELVETKVGALPKPALEEALTEQGLI